MASELRFLPYVALGAIADALSAAFTLAASPHQTLCNLNAVLGKPSGHRTICKTPMTYRMVTRARTQFKKWDNDKSTNI